MEYVHIGGVKVQKTAVLAPMAGVTDRAGRVLAREYGAELTYGEMASSAGLVYGDRKTPKLLMSEADEKPFAVQLFGNNPYFMVKAAVMALEYNPDIIDINAGCPMPKITGGGAGSALMKDLVLLADIIKAVVKAAGIPVTVKMRSGWDESSINAPEAAKICEECGASAVAIHARTRNQMYMGKADWDIIKQVKQAVKIPVIGNGDIINAESCQAMYEQTGCDLVMVGRAAWGKPWVFAEIAGKTPVLSLTQRLDVMTRHIDLLIADKGEFTAMKQARAHIAKYLRGVRDAAAYRNMCAGLTTRDDFSRLVESIKEDNKL